MSTKGVVQQFPPPIQIGDRVAEFGGQTLGWVREIRGDYVRISDGPHGNMERHKRTLITIWRHKATS